MTPDQSSSASPGGTRFSLVRWIVQAVGFAALAAGLAAAEPALKAYDIPAGKAEQSLKAYSEQSGQELLFATTTSGRVKTNAVKGNYTAEQALAALLAGTGLVASRDEGSGTLSVTRDPNAPRAIAPDSDRPKNRARAERDEGGEPVVRLDTFEVFGQKTLNMDVKRSREDAQPYVIFERSALVDSGARNLEDFLKSRLTMNSTAESYSQGLSQTFGNTSQINLRGLGTNQTLILIDGHRAVRLGMTGVTPDQPDINGIPLSAIERVEVLPTTASAIYGGGATGGVINIILRRDYAGAEVKFTHSDTFDAAAPADTVDLSAGLSFREGRTNVLLAASFSRNSPLNLGARDFLAAARARITQLNPGFLYEAYPPPLGRTTNIQSADGTPLVLKSGVALGSAITFVPVGYAGTATDGGAALVRNAGRYNLDLADSAQSSGRLRPLLRASSVSSFTASIRHDLAERVQAFVDLSFSENRAVAPTTSFSTFGYGVAAAAPNNPFQQDIVVSVPSGATDRIRSTQDIQDVRAVAGLVAELSSAWKLEGDVTYNRKRYWAATSPDLSPAVDQDIYDGRIDVLRDTAAFPLDLSGYLVAPTREASMTYTTMHDYTLRAGGPLVALPAGDLTLSALAEYRAESIPLSVQRITSAFIRVNPDLAQSAASLYTEAVFPLVSEAMRLGWAERLELQVAARGDAYDTRGALGTRVALGAPPVQYSTNRRNSVDPTVAVRYQPSKDLTLRGSTGTGFLPPDVKQLVPLVGDLSLSGVSFGDLGIYDPRRGDEAPTAQGQLISGGNPNLRPEMSRSWSVGVILTPRFLPQARLSLDWTSIAKKDEITGLDPQAFVDNEAYLPGRVTRGPRLPSDPAGWPGPITAIDASLVNVARTKVEALDAQLDYDFGQVAGGSLTFTAMATWQQHLRMQLTPNAPVVERVGVAGYPLKFRASGSLMWRSTSWNFAWSSSFYDGYSLGEDPVALANQGGSRIPSQLYHDVYLGYKVGAGRILAAWLANSECGVGVRNVFAEKPPFDAASSMFYSTYGDPRVRSYYVAIRKGF